MAAIVFIILHIVFATRAVLKIGEYYRNIHCLTSEFHVKFHAKNRYRTNRIAKATWAKPNVFHFILRAAPVRKQRKPFQSQCVFSYFECEWFSKILNLTNIRFL